jgi:hypothetical protein
LEVHHGTYDRFGGNELSSDLSALCATCHARADEARRAEGAAAIERAAKERARERRFERWMIRRYGGEWTFLGRDVIVEERAEFLDSERAL